jgi:hypothetical protein
MANPRRRLPTTLIAGSLGVLLAIEVTGIALARSNPVVAVEPAVAPAAVASADDALVGLGSALGRAIGSASTVTTGPIVEGLRSASTLTTFVAPAAQPAKAPVKTVKPKARPAAHATTTSFHGRNHVWIPSLRISRGLQSFPCSRSRPPDAGVYRWGCAGRNNVYLLSHAWSTFKPLHDAYVHGRLRKGMQVWYANANGTVHQYRVIWWRVTAPTTAASWAWASQSRPSMTLQTCVGSKSQYRLMVRLVQTA